MAIQNYNELNSWELDALKEIGSIGTGNAATALSSMIGKQVRIEVPEVRIMGYNEAIEWIGGPEEITAGVLVRISGQISGIMLSVQQLDFVNLVLGSMLNKHVEDYDGLHEMECSALIEVGNIMISTFINALSGLSGISIELTTGFYGGHAGRYYDCADGRVWWAVGLYYDDRRRFCLRRKENSLPSAFVPGDPLLELSVGKVGRKQWKIKSLLALPI